jgi:hypothetical protein
LFEREQDDLLADLKDIPRKACDRKVCLDIQLLFGALHVFYSIITVGAIITLQHVNSSNCSLSVCTPASFLTDLPVPQINEFVKRARQAKIHAYIIGQLKKDMPAMMGKNKAQKKLTDNLEDEFAKVRQLIGMSFGILGTAT